MAWMIRDETVALSSSEVVGVAFLSVSSPSSGISSITFSQPLLCTSALILAHQSWKSEFGFPSKRGTVYFRLLIVVNVLVDVLAEQSI